MTEQPIDPPKAALPKLLDRLPSGRGEASRDALLDLFLEYASALGLTLYPAQEEAILGLLDWKHVVLNTPTGSGKSLVAVALHFQAMAEGRRSFYTCPIKALANEKFFDLCDAFGPENVGLLTGDASVNPDAPIVCCTAEILANDALRGSATDVDYVVMDEFHFYGDAERGTAWQVPLVALRDAVFLMMSATLGDVSHIAKKVAEFTDREVLVVSRADRPVPLAFSYRETPMHETVEWLRESGEVPAYLVHFTQRASAEQAQGLTSLDLLAKEEKQAIASELRQARFDTPYGRELQRFLRAGVGVHHAGLLPKYRRLVERLSRAGMLKAICGTDSLGVGVNVPIRTVVFHQLCKWDGEKTRILSARQFHQIAGRAGRRGFDDHGSVVVQAPEHVIENRQIEAKLVKNPHLRNKLRRRSPPDRNYVHWDKSTFERLVGSPPEPLEPRFEVTHGMIINALSAEQDRPGGGYRRLIEMIGRSHGSAGAKKQQRRRASALFRALRRAEIVDLVRNPGRPGSAMRVRPGLQHNFSLNQTLSLYVVEALDLIDPDADSAALDMLTLVESVLENPTPVLIAQEDKLKGELMARLKAEGVDYEDRIAALEKVEHPKPLADLIYESFDMFAEHHPWVGGENIKPKSVGREMYERCLGFQEYVDDLGIARSEGVLLRYLSQMYKAASQTVPESRWNAEFEAILAFFHTMIKQVDSSLLEEWELLMDGEIPPPGDRSAPARPAPKPPDIAADPKRLLARVRSELHLLLTALARRSYREACNRVRQTPDHGWTESRFEQAMAPYFAEHASIDLTPRARQAHNTVLRATGPRQWEAQQKIIDPEGDEDWGLQCIVDLAGPWDDSEPLIELREIGV